jgi:DNA polymerase III delta prime subunit
LFKEQEERLRAVGKDRRSMVASLNRGIDVIRVKPAEAGVGGTVVGYVDEGRLRVVLKHEPEPQAPADWRLLGVESGLPRGASLARLTALWSVFNRQEADTAAGNAAQALDEFRRTKKAYQAWARSWQPPEIDAGPLVLHVSKKVRQDEAFSDEMLDDLFAGTAEVFIVKRLNARRQGETGLLLLLPSHGVCLGIFPAPFKGTGVGHWLLSFLDSRTDGVEAVSRLRADWLPANRADELEDLNDDWLNQISGAEQAYLQWRRTGWQPRELHGGFFRLRVSDRSKRELQQQGITPEELCAAMTRGLHLYEVTERKSNVLVAVPEGLACQIRLTPYTPWMGNSDWVLLDIRKADSALPVFARVVARWEEGAPGRSPLSGNAPGLIRELEVLQGRRQEVAQKIVECVDHLSSNSPKLSEQLACWQRICELERGLLDVGVTRLERDGQGYLLVPEEQMMVEEWIDGLESLNPEGINWDRYHLELRVGNDKVRLVIRSVAVAQAGEGEVEIVLRVSCGDLRGRELVERVCDGVALGEGEEGEDVRLFLPDTQLRLIDNALTLLDPRQKTRSEKPGIVGEELVPDDLSVSTLQTILATPDELEPITAEWPSLPEQPLVPLSPKQEEAVRAAVFGPDMTLIQGPPGTGKTTVILEILRQLFHLHGKDAGFKVLLVAPTHVAVDNVLERLIAPRHGTNLVMELGVAPYRVGSTRRIAEHLRGFTPDCLNTQYREKLEKDVARDLEAAERNWQGDLKVLEILEDGAACDAVSWWYALQSGEFLDLGPWDWHPSLEVQLPKALNDQQGRVRIWRDYHTRGNNPRQRIELLQRWLDFLRNNPRFFSELLLANANLVCATTIGCATHPELRSVVYDYVIVDEAGKEEARRLLVPLIRGERWVLVGDHQQLPPYADDRLQVCLVREGLDPRTVTRSLFEELQEPFERTGRFVFLDRQGRMHPDISAFVSEQFYKGRLNDFDHVANHSMPRPAFLPESPKLLVLDTRQLSDRQEKKRGTGYVNLLEQELAVFILRAFANLPVFQSDLADQTKTALPTLGVIAPYRLQVEGIENLVRQDQHLKELLREGVLHVGTVDSFQGQERDLIIFTCTRSNSEGRLGFVDNRQRLNVALSRARCRLIVIADGSTVDNARLRSDLKDIEAETRDHLHALFAFARDRDGVLEVPGEWRTRWHG